MLNMLTPRVIPCLLLHQGRLVKTVRFANPTYIGDPLNAMKLFNAHEADELLLLDISATAGGAGPSIDFLERVASECFMPVCYGGGITSVCEVKRIVSAGIEKVSIGAAAVSDPTLIAQTADRFGTQCVVACIDVALSTGGAYEVVTHNATVKTGLDPLEQATRMAELGAGELLIQSVDRDGTMEGYDLPLIRRIARNVDVPVIACGGASRLNDMAAVIQEAQASAAAAGSLFVFFGKHRAVLINYPEQEELAGMFQ